MAHPALGAQPATPPSLLLLHPAGVRRQAAPGTRQTYQGQVAAEADEEQESVQAHQPGGVE